MNFDGTNAYGTHFVVLGVAFLLFRKRKKEDKEGKMAVQQLLHHSAQASGAVMCYKKLI
jgi:hypothetical protein